MGNINLGGEPGWSFGVDKNGILFVRFVKNQTYNMTYFGTKNVSDGKWHDVGFVLQKNNFLDIYVDGAVDKEYFTEITNISNNNLLIIKIIEKLQVISGNIEASRVV